MEELLFFVVSFVAQDNSIGTVGWLTKSQLWNNKFFFTVFFAILREF